MLNADLTRYQKAMYYTARLRATERKVKILTHQ
jgi:hypothetical protein